MNEKTLNEHRLHAIELLLESFEGNPAPYDLSQSVIYIRENIDNFEEYTGWNKASKMIEFLENHGLAKETRDKNKMVKIQPTVSLSKWMDDLQSKYQIFSFDREIDELQADSFSPNVIKFNNLSQFVEIFNKYNVREIYFGNAMMSSLNNDGFRTEEKAIWFHYYTTIYSYPQYDITSLEDIENILRYGIHTLDQKRIEGSSVKSEVLNKLEIYDPEIASKYDANFSKDNEETITLYKSQPAKFYKELKRRGFSSIDHAIEAFQSDMLYQTEYEKFKELRNNYPEESELRIKQILYSGFPNMDEFEDALAKGFFLKSEYEAAKKFGLNTASEYRDAISKEYPDPESYSKGDEAGYENYKEYSMAKRAGFDNVEDFRNAKAKGFTSHFEWVEANELDLSSKEEYEEFKRKRRDRISQIKPILLQMIDLMRDGHYTLGQLQDVIEGKVMASKTDIHMILESDEDLQQHGTYDKTLRMFYKGKGSTDIPMNNSESSNVIVDVANVAWHGVKQHNGSKPKLANIEMMMRAIERRNIENPIFLAKATLRHMIDDRERFQEYIENGVIKETPAGNDDDEYILKTAIRTNSYIISNDLFRDWQNENKKFADKIKELSTKYSIDGDMVNFDGTLDNWLKNPKSRYQS